MTDRTRRWLIWGTVGALALIGIVFLVRRLRRKNRMEPVVVASTCPVCDTRLLGGQRYCSSCGSRV
jgi:predicted nucleic acid-binding Zn ribbon protein